MTIQVYAVLKDFFEGEFTIDAPLQTIEKLHQHLLELSPEANRILSVSRYAVNDTFVENNFELNQYDNIHIIPPSSGG